MIRRAFLVLVFSLLAVPAFADDLDAYRPQPSVVMPQLRMVQQEPGVLEPPPSSAYPIPTRQQAPQPLPPVQQIQPQPVQSPPQLQGSLQVEAPSSPGLMGQNIQAATPKQNFDDWLNALRQDAISKGIRGQTVYYVLNNVYPDERIVEKDQKQPENTTTAQQYWDRLLSDDRIQRGREFFASNKDVLRRVSESYSVRARYIVALLGIESNYGQGQGKENIINALVTLAYDGRRSDYFRDELFNAMRIIDAGNVRPENMTGSWAGAMGYCQFMPSSYLKFAQDYDGDGKIDIWDSIPDAAASAANYLHQSGWHVAEDWGQEVSLSGPVDADLVGTKVRKSVAEWRALGVVKQKNGHKLPNSSTMASLVQPDGPEGRSFLVYNNFYVLMRWNRSTYFAIAVGMLADMLGGR